MKGTGGWLFRLTAINANRHLADREDQTAGAIDHGQPGKALAVEGRENTVSSELGCTAPQGPAIVTNVGIEKFDSQTPSLEDHLPDRNEALFGQILVSWSCRSALVIVSKALWAN